MKVTNNQLLTFKHKTEIIVGGHHVRTVSTRVLG
jgi:hypothetical protein